MRDNKWGMHPFGTWHIYKARKDWANVEMEGSFMIWPRPTPDVLFGTYGWLKPSGGSTVLLLRRKNWNFEQRHNRYLRSVK